MWQTASTHLGMIPVPAVIWYVLYFTSCSIALVCLALSLARVCIFPAALASDFHHPRLFNFFYLPVIIGALCVLTTPPFLRSQTQFRVAFYLLGVYQLALALYLFGEWLFGAHPTNFIHPLVFMQTIGFFLLANIAATALLFQQALAMYTVGILFWLLVFFTNFQHVALALDKRRERPTPTFFLFIAPPAQIALSTVVLELARTAADTTLTSPAGLLKAGLIDVSVKVKWPVLGQAFLYVDLFLYLLIFRLFPTFWTSKFSISSWAYIFPLSAAATATIWRYKSERGMFWGVLGIILALLACIAMLVVLGFTLWSLFSKRTPSNDECRRAYQRYYTRMAMPPTSSARSSRSAQSNGSGQVRLQLDEDTDDEDGGPMIGADSQDGESLSGLTASFPS